MARYIVTGDVFVLYDMLTDYRERMAGERRPETARTYTNRLETLLEGQSVTDPIHNLDFDLVLNKLSAIKHKNEFSQYKNAFLYFAEFYDIPLDNIFMEQLKEIESNAHKKYRKSHNADFKKIDRTIKHLSNHKLKLSYRTLLDTGLRVSELSQVTKKDVRIDNTDMQFFFIGKGGYKESVTLYKEDNPKLFQELKNMIQDTKPGQKVFYSANYLQSKAKKYGFQCHDLRRACSKIEYKKSHSKRDVQEKLRHKNTKTTDIYLKSKIKI